MDLGIQWANEHSKKKHELGRAGGSMPRPSQFMSPCMLGMLGTYWGTSHGGTIFTRYYRCLEQKM